jgi:Polyketide cyclase / dehydrase and lipid transport
MPTDKASASVVIAAPLETVLAAVRDVAAQVEWVSEITEAELLEVYEDDTPATASFVMVTKLGTEHYTLEFEHADDAMTWSLVSGELQKAQDGEYRLTALDTQQAPASTEVTLTLEIEHSIKAPGFVRRMVFNGIVQGNVASLKKYVESSSLA